MSPCGFLVCWVFAKRIYDFLAIPIIKSLPVGTKLVFTKPTDPFILYMKVAFLAGIFLTLPLIFYEVWKFIAPGLYRKEKKYVVPFLVCSMVLFLLGAAFCYYIVLPPTFKILIEMGSSFTPMILINEYLDMTNMMLLGFGAIFEMPVLAAFLSIFGLVTASFLWRKFKYATRRNCRSRRHHISDPGRLQFDGMDRPDGTSLYCQHWSGCSFSAGAAGQSNRPDRLS